MALYEALQLGQPGNTAIPDHYTPAATLICPRCKRLMLQVSQQAVVVQLGKMDQGVGVGAGSVTWQAEEPYLPIIAAFGRDFDAVRVRNYVAGAAGQVIVTPS
jgi:hypothetical protein